MTFCLVRKGFGVEYKLIKVNNMTLEIMCLQNV